MYRMISRINSSLFLKCLYGAAQEVLQDAATRRSEKSAMPCSPISFVPAISSLSRSVSVLTEFLVSVIVHPSLMCPLLSHNFCRISINFSKILKNAVIMRFFIDFSAFLLYNFHHKLTMLTGVKPYRRSCDDIEKNGSPRHEKIRHSGNI